MTQHQLEGHVVKRFDGELASIHRLALEMGGLVVHQIDTALEALGEKNAEEAEEVIARDHDINRIDEKVDHEIVRLIALRQPKAVDLRDIMTVGKVVADLERAGDEARKIAALVGRLYGGEQQTPKPQLLTDVFSMARFSAQMMRDTLQAFDDLDLDRAVEVIRANEDIEEQFRNGLRRLSTFIMEDARSVGHFIEVVLVLRAIERIGGHAKNVAGHVFFLVKGVDARHVDLRHLAGINK